MIGTPSRLSWPTNPNSSSDAPLLDSTSATSSRPTSPRSPCRESTGWRNEACVPVEVNVAAILRAIRPDLPTPDTITRPFADARRRTAAVNAGLSRSATRVIAPASRARTRRPRSTRSVGSVRGIAVLTKKPVDETLPFAAGLEDQLRNLTHGPLAPRRGRDDAGGVLHFAHTVRHADGEAHAGQQRQVGEVVADEGALLPTQSSPRQQLPECGKLARGGVLNQLVHAELPGAQRGGGRFPSRHPRDREPGGAKHADADAVLDVKPFELHRVVADHADVDRKSTRLNSSHRCISYAV